MEAAHALWRYAYASAEQVFGNASGNSDLDRLMVFVDASGMAGVTRSQVSTELFSRNRPAEQLDQLLRLLLDSRRYEVTRRQAGHKTVTACRRKIHGDS